MTFFVDANVILYSVSASAYQEACAQIIDAIASGTDGRTSTAALEEVWYLELTGRAKSGLTERAYQVFAPLLPVTDETFRSALALEAGTLQSNDRLHAATCLAYGIETIVTADQGFERVRGIRRVDPLDERARRKLLAAG